jgi:hypothetical protein
MKLRLILDVEYLSNTTNENQLRAMLTHMVNHAVSVGGLTGETDAEVEAWDMRIHRLESETTK